MRRDGTGSLGRLLLQTGVADELMIGQVTGCLDRVCAAQKC